MHHHAFVVEAEIEAGVVQALSWAKAELGLEAQANPDVIVLRYGLFTVADARRVNEVAAQAPLRGEHKVLVIAATRAYHEAQNALLKLFEEPPRGTYLFLILPSLGGVLPTLRSRVQVLARAGGRRQEGAISDDAREFMHASPEKRSALIKKLATGRDEDERRDNRDRTIAIVNGIELAAREKGIVENAALLSDIQVLRSHLYDRSAPVKMILEHLSSVIPKSLSAQAGLLQ
jgi:hypothetical protein